MDNGSDIDPESEGVNPAEEFCADPNEHWPFLIICAVLEVLSVVGVGWTIVKPGEVQVEARPECCLRMHVPVRGGG